MQLEHSELPVDAEKLQLSLEKRLRARAARAEKEVELTPEMLERWIQEELEALMAEYALARDLAYGRIWN